MIRRQQRPDVTVLWDRIERKVEDCIMTGLPALERALDGLNPSMWVADEAAEYKGRTTPYLRRSTASTPPTLQTTKPPGRKPTRACRSASPTGCRSGAAGTR